MTYEVCHRLLVHAAVQKRCHEVVPQGVQVVLPRKADGVIDFSQPLGEGVRVDELPLLVGEEIGTELAALLVRLHLLAALVGDDDEPGRGCSFKNCSICSTSPLWSCWDMTAKCSVGGASSVRSKRRLWIRWKLSSRQRYSTSHGRVANVQSGLPCAAQRHSHSASHDLPIFGAPASRCSPCGSRSSTRNDIGS